ncbi:dehydrodolichyl diphosphate synthase [Thamnocephalis sphaerospora]|uniref:Alkyl transferase n=1 Tax=Thamnocephalis sphaerospora TaxID=78915 RepID=A0A4P9XIX7_9FUNG|nr:dehydrodolichyl diphosphate synthase [Thamnocephalis sphaerospora]|eukprot:RKP05668.1 dehydrodolichyl diphosphate synthase [Thamnocephalis sphaerospora]
MNLLDSCWNGTASMLRRSCIALARHGQVPRHIAFIMDGNRRFARKMHAETAQGHRWGFDTLEHILEWCLELGVEAVSVYAFSIENFKRPHDEVETLMNLTKEKLAMLCEKSELVRQYNVRIRIIGNLDLLPADVREACEHAMRMTAAHTKATLNICMPYTSRDEMTTAVRRAMRGVEHAQLEPSDIDEELLERCLYTSSSPDVDILVRTSGEVRLSDYLLWQCGEHCQVHFVQQLWPELSAWRLLPLVLDYQRMYSRIQAGRNQRAARLRQEREKRAWKQLQDQGLSGDAETVARLVQERDERVAQFLRTFEAHTTLPTRF